MVVAAVEGGGGCSVKAKKKEESEPFVINLEKYIILGQLYAVG